MASIQSLSFIPTSISGCSLWLDAADPTTVTTSGTTVTAWRDKSGQANNAIFSGSNPTYVPSNRFVETSGLNQYFTVPGTILNTTAGSIFFVFADKQQNPTNGVIFGGDSNYLSNNFYAQSGLRNDGFSYALTGVNVPPSGFLTQINTTNTILYNQNYIYNSSNLSAGINGTLYSMTSVFGNQVVTPSGAVGISGTSWGGCVNLKMNELLFFNSILTSFQRQQVEGYLAWKWGLQGSLPSTHPFKLIAPNSQNLSYPSQLSIPVPVQSAAPTTVPLIFFNPASISGCQLWLDGNDPLATGSRPSNGTSISTWFDKSGNARNATAVSAGTFNSGVVFNGTTNYYSMVVPYSSNYSIFLVATNTTTPQCYYFARTGTPGNHPSFVQGYSGTSIEWYEVADRPTIVASPSSPFLVSVAHTQGVNISAYYFGTQTVSIPQTQAYSSSNWIILGAADSNAALYGGTMKDLLFYNTVLSTSQRQLVEGYLAWKWSLVGNLPSNHPYKQNIPGLGPPVPLLSFGMVPATFSPSRMAGLQVWFDASDLNGNGTNPVNGSVLSSWVDKSSNAYSLIQPTASNQPTYTTPALNGLGGVQVNTTTWLYRVGSNMTNFTTGSNTSVFMALRNASGNTSWNIFHTLFFNAGGVETAGARYHFSFNSNTSQGLTLLLTGSTQKLYNASWVTPPLSNAIVGFTASPIFTTMNWNGNTMSGTGITLPSSADATLFIFQDPRAIAANSNCVIYEMLGFNTQLSASQAQLVEGYLAWKWGLQGNLPVTHPFRRFPPPPN